MSERLYKGKDKDTGEWVVGYYCPVCCGRFPCSPSIISKSGIDKGRWEPVEIILETLCESTGLPDRNGTEIFTKDIIKSDTGVTWIVDFERNAYVCKDEEGRIFFSLFQQWDYNWEELKAIPPSNRFEIISNVYDRG